MILSGLIEGIQILMKYYKKDGWHLSAEHDEISMDPTDTPVEPADLERLCKLGWFQSGIAGDDEDFAPKHYDPEEGWSAFT